MTSASTAIPLASAMVHPKGRFARSVNVERDRGNGIEGYLPTGRALDVIGRIGRAIVGQSSSRAFSITGPYGSGKSSLAVFVDAVLGPVGSERSAAHSILAAAAPDALVLYTEGAGNERGFVRALTTATREPVAATVTRALAAGAARFKPERRGQFNAIRRSLDNAVVDLSDTARPLPSTRFIQEMVEALSEHAPVLLMIDEFGKNLEAFSDSRSEADLYLLQQLVEWSDGSEDLRLLTITLQHLAFDEYLDTVSMSLRREWAKVQGRFEDIPYVDMPRQTRHLIGQVMTHDPNPRYRSARDRWAKREWASMRALGIAHETEQGTVAAAWPLHPSALLVLPDLCSRYGQNERTLFSFMASAEPLAVPAWAVGHAAAGELESIRLDRVYDYFVESASTTAGTAQTASRWVEIETSIRDASGLDEAERRVLKVVGLLNLVTSGGVVRASKAIVCWSCADGQLGSEDPTQVEAVLARLEASGKITYREFADEYRLWHGSDLDIRGAVESARRRARSQSLVQLLQLTRPMLPVVATRHSTKTGTMRAFARVWAAGGQIDPPLAGAPEDGLIVYSIGDAAPVVTQTSDIKPVVIVEPQADGGLLACAIELAALRDVLVDAEVIGDDWVARRELHEREAEAVAQFETAFEATFGFGVPTLWSLSVGGTVRELGEQTSVTAGLSAVCDEIYPDCPPVPNEMINRFQLTSQGAKARRILIEAMLLAPDNELLGLGEGYPPERSMYEAVLRVSGIHRQVEGELTIAPPLPGTGWDAVWSAVEDQLEQGQSHRVGIDRVLEALALPPIGLKAGVAPIVVIAAILHHRSEVAIYEHGTYRPRLTPVLCERLLRNPAHFELKHFAATRGPRRDVVERLATALGVSAGWRGKRPTVLSVVSHLVGLTNGMTDYAKRTRSLTPHAAAVRRALLDATEPDVLLFETLPSVLGMSPVKRSGADEAAIEAYVGLVASTIQEIESSYERLLQQVVARLRISTSASAMQCRAELKARAEMLDGRIIDPKLRSLCAALTVEDMDHRAWAEYVAMVVVGPPPASWSDDDVARYESNISEVGGTLRRVEAISFERRAAGQSDATFDAIRVTATRPDGSEQARVVALTEAARSGYAPQVDELVALIASDLGSRTQAVELAAALLAERLLPPSQSRPVESRNLASDDEKSG